MSVPPDSPFRSLSRFAHEVIWSVQASVVIVLMALVGALLAGTLPALVGFESFVVLSGSMRPTLQVGDLAVVQPVAKEHLAIGDIISYRLPSQPDTIVTHRLVDIEDEGDGHVAFYTRGDANEAVDRVPVEASAVLGRVWYAVPVVGYVTAFARRTEGMLLLIGLPILLLAVDSIRSGQLGRVVGGVAAGNSVVGDETNALVGRGRLLLAGGQVNSALSIFDQAIAANPRTPDAWLLRASCLTERQSRLTCLQAGLLVNPSSEHLRLAVADASTVLYDL